MIKERPILYSTPMVQAKLAGRKTQTRRMINPQPADIWMENTKKFSANGSMYDRNGKQLFWLSGGSGEIKCRYGKPGDILWSRETWTEFHYRDTDSLQEEWKYIYKADQPDDLVTKYKPSIHQPKSASRIWERVTEVRVERLQDISPGDACDEGIQYDNIDWEAHASGELVADFRNYTWRDDPNYKDYYFPSFASCIDSYRSLWESINGEESWDLNPWVFVITTEVLSITGRPKDL